MRQSTVYESEQSSIFFKYSPDRIFERLERETRKKTKKNKKEDRKDCFALDGKSCTILKAVKFKCNNCVFYKTKEKAEEDKLKSLLLIKKLDVVKQEYINRKYLSNKHVKEKQ